MTETQIRADADRAALADVVARVWAEVLKVDAVDRGTNFFALGGNSLQGARVIGRLREELDVRIPVRFLFDAQTVVGLAEEIDRLREGGAASLSTIGPALDRGTGPFRAPTSFAQRRLWVEEQVLGPGAAYTVPFAVEVEGPLDVDALRAAVADLVRRHEVFRTGFEPLGGVPVQVVQPTLPEPFEVVDFSHLAGAGAERAVADHLVAATRRPFDIRRPPLLRVELLRVEPEFAVLFLAMHHLITDARSFEVVAAELLDAYRARVEGLPPAPPPRLHYADFAAWQQRTVDQASFDEQVDYWRNRLAAPRPVLDLTTDLAPPAERTGAGATEAVPLTRAMSRGLRALARKNGATPFMVVLAGFTALLHRYTGQTDVIVGTPTDSRDTPELADMPGFFVNTVALRCDASGDPAFTDLLARVREVVLGAFAHRDVPFERVLKAVSATRSGPDRLFSVLLAYQHEPPRPALPGLDVVPLDLDTGTAKFDLSIVVTETESGHRLAVEHSTELFTADTARRLLDHLRVLLEGAVATPSARLSELPVMSAGERDLVESWAVSGYGPYPVGATLHGMVEEQARRTPDAVAVRCGDARLTYAELDRRAAAVASVLAARGAGPERFVGLYAEPSVDLVVGLLGILKSGAAYVPVDPLAPTERLRFVAADSGAVAFVTTAALRDALPLEGVEVVCFGEEAAGDGAVPGPVAPDQLAYLMYTSGSTGRPKGVAVAHGQVTPLLHWARENMPLGDGGGVLQHLAHFFDWSVEEIFHPLVSGACLVVCPPAVKADPAATAALITEGGVTALYTTPSQMRGFVAAGIPLPTLRHLSFGGEKLTEDLVAATHALVSPECLVWNGYGPTECSVSVAAEPVPPAAGRRSAPLGKPLANATCRVVDEWGDPVPVGVPGELWLGGDGVARGYHGRPDLTAERFVPDPTRPGKRAYRSGDLARRLPDSGLEFLGRLDQQVKLRGVRVELGEVESVLREHPSVADAAVVLDEPGQRLVGYLVGEAVDETAVRAHLSRALPGYLQPAVLVPVPALPRTGTGKVDRAALPRPEAAVAGRAPGRAPSTDTERAVAAVWTGRLGHDGFDADTNFFAAGGDSLMLLTVVEDLSREFKVEIPVRTLIDAPTVAALATRVELLLWASGSTVDDVGATGEREVGEL